MGRPRNFSEGDVLDAAADAFTTGGYEGTSIDDLVKALGLHRGSLYKAFGSKHGLFVAALRHYVDTLLADLTRRGDPRASVDRLISGPGLDLLLIAAIERGHQDLHVAALVRQALSALEEATKDTATPPRATDTATRPERAVGLLGTRLYERLYDDRPQTPIPHTARRSKWQSSGSTAATSQSRSKDSTKSGR